jgi:hypothetical protein
MMQPRPPGYYPPYPGPGGHFIVLPDEGGALLSTETIDGPGGLPGEQGKEHHFHLARGQRKVCWR